MAPVQCLYCGAEIGAEDERCPACNAPSHFQQRGAGAGRRRRFLLWFVVIAVATLVVALILPR